MRLIDADELIEILADMQGRCNTKAALIHNSKIWKLVKTMPTVEVEPVRHAHWIWKGDEGYSRFMCSECGKTATVPTCMGKPDIWEYCPHCGAKLEDEHGKPCDDCQEFDCYGCKYAERKEE